MLGLRFCSGGSSSLKSASLLVGCRRIPKSKFVVRRLLDEGLNGLLRWDMLRRYNFRWLLRRRVRCRRIQRRKLLPHLQSARRLVSKLMLRCRSWRSARSLRIRCRWPRRWGRRSYRGLRWSMSSVGTRSSWWSLEQLNSSPHEPRRADGRYCSCVRRLLSMLRRWCSDRSAMLGLRRRRSCLLLHR